MNEQEKHEQVNFKEVHGDVEILDFHEHTWIKQWDRRRCIKDGCGAEEVFLFPDEGENGEDTQPDLLTSEDEVNGAVEVKSTSTRTEEKGEETSEQSEEGVGVGLGEEGGTESKGKGTRRKGATPERGAA